MCVCVTCVRVCVCVCVFVLCALCVCTSLQRRDLIERRGGAKGLSCSCGCSVFRRCSVAAASCSLARRSSPWASCHKPKGCASYKVDISLRSCRVDTTQQTRAQHVLARVQCAPLQHSSSACLHLASHRCCQHGCLPATTSTTHSHCLRELMPPSQKCALLRFTLWGAEPNSLPQDGSRTFVLHAPLELHHNRFARKLVHERLGVDWCRLCRRKGVSRGWRGAAAAWCAVLPRVLTAAMALREARVHQ
jgi:hypothetical protein